MPKMTREPSDRPCNRVSDCAKNFGLYGEHAGTLSFVCTDANRRDRVGSQLKAIVRPIGEYDSTMG